MYSDSRVNNGLLGLRYSKPSANCFLYNSIFLLYLDLNIINDLG